MATPDPIKGPDEQPSFEAILEAWDAIVLGYAPRLTAADDRTPRARAHYRALELHAELLAVTVNVLNDMTAESLDRTVTAWGLLSSRLPEFDGLEALLVDGLTTDEYREAVTILADELLERHTGCQGFPEPSGHTEPRTITPTEENYE
ncbi:hypothetical protein ACOCJ7_07080 [Knoellia sp. CPCC 206453]|uniref:hypothetical protein n=1 Tax=Knoellia pratensis TaxID=3404796 RepID=UPI0036201D78